MIVNELRNFSRAFHPLCVSASSSDWLKIHFPALTRALAFQLSLLLITMNSVHTRENKEWENSVTPKRGQRSDLVWRILLTRTRRRIRNATRTVTGELVRAKLTLRTKGAFLLRLDSKILNRLITRIMVCQRIRRSHSSFDAPWSSDLRLINIFSKEEAKSVFLILEFNRLGFAPSGQYVLKALTSNQGQV